MHFSQILIDANGDTSKSTAGTLAMLAMLAPMQFRWETLTPCKQTLVTDWRADTDGRTTLRGSS